MAPGRPQFLEFAALVGGDHGLALRRHRTVRPPPPRTSPKSTECRKVHDAHRRTVAEHAVLIRHGCTPLLQVIRVSCIPRATAYVGPIVRSKVLHGSRWNNRRRDGRACPLAAFIPPPDISTPSQTNRSSAALARTGSAAESSRCKYSPECFETGFDAARPHDPASNGIHFPPTFRVPPWIEISALEGTHSERRRAFSRQSSSPVGHIWTVPKRANPYQRILPGSCADPIIGTLSLATNHTGTSVTFNDIPRSRSQACCDHHQDS
jgi:hypothetical protein